MAAALLLLDLLADGAGLFLRIPGGMDLTRSLSGSDCSVNRVLPSRPSLWAIRWEAAPRICSVER
jgi:hypothetical protein